MQDADTRGGREGGILCLPAASQRGMKGRNKNSANARRGRGSKMKFRQVHSWDVTPKEAMAIQERLRDGVVQKRVVKHVRLIAGADIALDPKTGTGYAGVIVYRFDDLSEVERAGAEGRLTFPYVPGLLSFREAPLLLDAISRLESRPDIFVFDGQGIAHMRGFGIATHMGVILDTPSIGCAKSRLVGEYDEPGKRRGDWSPLRYGGRTVGAVLRTREGVKPVFVSPGHKVTLAQAVRILLACHQGYRIPKPTREADRFVALLKRQSLQNAGCGQNRGASTGT